MFGMFGDGASLGPFGNAGPSSADGDSPFNFSSGNVTMGGGGASSMVPTIVAGVVVLGVLWLTLKK